MEIVKDDYKSKCRYVSRELGRSIRNKGVSICNESNANKWFVNSVINNAVKTKSIILIKSKLNACKITKNML